MLVKDISPGVPNSAPGVFKVASGTLFFTATSQYLGRELYKTDGTAAGTVMVANSAYSYLSLFVDAAASSGNLLFYRAWEDNGCCKTCSRKACSAKRGHKFLAGLPSQATGEIKDFNV